MDKDDIEKVLSLFDAMEDCERAMFEYYLACTTLTSSAGQKQFCLDMSEEEKDHITVIGRIRQIFLKSPASFKLLGHFEISDLVDFCVRVKKETGRIESGSVTLEQALQAASELEGSLIESIYFEVISSENDKYLELAQIITNANNRHKEKLMSMLGNPA